MVLAGHKCTVGMESVSEPQDTEQGARHGKHKRASGANCALEGEGQAAVTQAKKKRRPKQDTIGVSQGLQVCVRASMHVCVHVCACEHVCVCVCVCVIDACMHVFMYTRAHTHTYTHTTDTIIHKYCRGFLQVAGISRSRDMRAEARGTVPSEQLRLEPLIHRMHDL